MKKKIDVNFILLTFYILLVGVMVICHEPWRDEAQAWLIARDLSPLEIIFQMRYEGHPFLWHYILMPFAKLGFPYITINIISAIICIVAAIILLKRAPFNNIIKALVLVTTPFIYYSYVSRSYCLAVLAVVLIATFYNEREKRPILYGGLLCFLANTHIVMLGLTVIITIMQIWDVIICNKNKYSKSELRNHYIGIGIAGIGILTMFIIALIGGISNSYTKIFSLKETFMNLFSLLNKNAVYLINCLTMSKIFSMLFLSAFIILLYLLIIKRDIKMLIIISFSIFFEILISTVAYSLSWYTVQTLILFIIFLIWISWEKLQSGKILKYISNIVIIVIFASNIRLNGELIYNDIFYNYSASRDVAKFINENIEESAVFLCSNDFLTSSIIPYVSQKMSFIFLPTKEEFSFVKFSNERTKKINEWTKECSYESIITNKDDVYYIYAYDLPEEELNLLEEKNVLLKLYQSTSVTDEDYEIFKINN